MSNDHIKSEILPYLAGGLTESRNRHIEAHAASCEKCRNAITKAKAKQARSKREALKKASSDPLPNLFLARQGRTSGVDSASSSAPLMFLAALLLAGAGYGVYRHYFSGPRAPAVPVMDSESASVETSSAPVAISVPVPVAPTASQPPPPPPAARSGSVKPSVPLTFQKEWRGSDSGIQEARLVVVRKQTAWDDLWAEMKTAPAPDVDFDEHVVVGVFAGEHPAGSAVAFGDIQEADDNIVIPYRVISIDVAVSTTSAPSHPYLLTLFPRVDKKIRLTQKEASQ